MFLDFEKNVQKNAKTYVQFQRPLNHSAAINSLHSYRKSVALSRQHQTCLLGRSVHIHKKLSNLELRVINVYKSSNALDGQINNLNELQ